MIARLRAVLATLVLVSSATVTAKAQSTTPFAITDGEGHRALGVGRGVSFFESEYQLITPSGLRQFDMPRKSNFQGLLKGRLLIRLAEPWTTKGAREA